MTFRVRQNILMPWVYEVWDCPDHQPECNYTCIVTVDSKGAWDDGHEKIAEVCADALNAHYGGRYGHE